MSLSQKRKLLISQMEEYLALLDKSVIALLYPNVAKKYLNLTTF
jgi:hypothetical protein